MVKTYRIDDDCYSLIIDLLREEEERQTKVFETSGNSAKVAAAELRRTRCRAAAMLLSVQRLGPPR